MTSMRPQLKELNDNPYLQSTPGEVREGQQMNEQDAVRNSVSKSASKLTEKTEKSFRNWMKKSFMMNEKLK